MLWSASAPAPAAPPAGGAAFTEILIAVGIFTVAYVPLGWFLLRERGGHRTLLGRLADRLSAMDGMPRWAGLPIYLTALSLVTAGFGVYWDVPIHMQYGRDEGPLANPSHYPILFGILGFLAAGVIAAGLAKDPLPRRTVRFAKDWHVPMGSMLLLGAGLIAAVGFPADDLWHRLFGQDVTEWGPTHVMMIGGAVTSMLAVPLLLAEARQAGARPFGAGFRRLVGGIVTGCLRLSGAVLPPVRREVARIDADRSAWAVRFFQTVAVGFCTIPFAFLMEFDLGVPQFPAATLFVISGFLTAWIFTAARITFGPGGALVAWGTYLVLRMLIWLITLPLPHIHHARWLLFVGAALAVELLALVLQVRGRLFAATAGVLAGVAGMAADAWWMGVFMPAPLPLDAAHLPWLLGVAAVAGLGGGLLGLVWARHLARIAAPGAADVVVHDAPAGGSLRWTGTIGVLLFVGLMAGFAPPKGQGEVEATKECADGVCRTTYEPVGGSDVVTGEVTYDDACLGEEDCRAEVTVRLHPADAADDALWISAIAYQGFHERDEVYPSGQLTTEMVPTGEPGEYHSADPLPLYGQWKVFLRLHTAPTTMLGLPLHMPADAALKGPAAGLVEVADGDTAPFVYEPLMLQRERKDGVPIWLWSVAYGLVIAAWLGLLAFYGWCFSAAARGGTTVRAGAPRVHR